ncbi:hypothetical protein K505DRAFT_333101 [Melanomma pulvis-pyrius CBS 109.77]|uniref:Heme haloperoxidase family profile domain-containing protein n=1 Tax=Melanomma pulvis-pyrius CBS 109.77 TaxID=1314802 RepID=A0A6A6XR31_9PLEO|nr:hypothetical protein K505DRAFT_333101 [Melanomma pulvis-pyrius CBS 109.77]
MRYFTSLALVGAAVAQNVSVCDKYTTALLKENNATNQYTLLTLLVNTVVIGNYTQPNMNAVPGILAKGKYMDKEVNLLPYFDGTLLSSNRGGESGVSINFLDDGGAVPLMNNMPANGTKSEQYFLLTHLYQFFGKLLGCSTYGTDGFPKYSGHSMASAHAFMDLDPSEIGYFITQVGLAATSFGVTTEDVTAVAAALNKLFGYRCSPPAVVIPEMNSTLNSICQNEECPLDAMATCAAYPKSGVVAEPKTANMSMTMSSNMSMASTAMSSATGTAAMSGTMSPSATTTGVLMSTGAAGSVGAGIGAVVGALALGLAL